MPSPRPAVPRVPGRGALLLLVVLAAVATVGFRAGALPGGLVGVDVALAALGWWVGSAGSTVGAWRGRGREAWVRWWPALVAALVLSVIWVLVEPSTAHDRVVRGEALAAVVGYGNWHQLSLGPVEALASRSTTPLQHLWAVAVAAQCLLVFGVLTMLVRRVGARLHRPAPSVALPALVLGLAGVGTGVGLAVAGASGQALLLSTPTRGGAFFLGAFVGAAGPGSLGAAVRAGAAGFRVPVAVLLVAATAVPPGSDAGRFLGVSVVPLLAALAVAVVAPRPAAPDEPPIVAADAPVPVATDPWRLLAAWWVVATPCFAVARAIATGAPAWASTLVALPVSVALALVVAWLGGWITDEPGLVQWRRVLAPPAVVALLVAILSVTGAFHWESPRPRSEWPAQAPR